MFLWIKFCLIIVVVLLIMFAVAIIMDRGDRE